MKKTAVVLALFICSTVFAKDVIVNPGGSINSAITANTTVAGDRVLVSPGTYVGGVSVTKPITLEANGTVILRASSTGNGTGVDIRSSSCAVIGFRLENFSTAIGAWSGTYSGVTVRGNHSYACQYHIIINGANWLVESNKFERCIWYTKNASDPGDSDYGRMWGTGHVYRKNMCFGTRFDTQDVIGATEAAHVDGLQYYGNGGQILRDVTIEDNYFADAVQFLFLCDEGSSGALARVTIRRNLFYSAKFTPASGGGNLQGRASWGICIGKSYGGKDMVVENNTLWNCANALGIRAASTGRWTKNILTNPDNQGTCYDPSSTTANQVTVDNNATGFSWLGQSGYTGTTTQLTPQFVNTASPLGGDGLLGTADDGFRPQNASLAGYGYAIAAAPPTDITPPSIAVNPPNPATVTVGSAYVDPGATATDSGAPVPVTTTGVVNTAVVGQYVLTYTARDAVGNTALATRTVNVVAAPPQQYVTQAEMTAAMAALKASLQQDIANAIAAEAKTRGDADTALGVRVDDLDRTVVRDGSTVKVVKQ